MMAPVHRTGVAEARPFGRYEEPNIIRRRTMGESRAGGAGEIKSQRPTDRCGDGSLTRQDGSKTRPHMGTAGLGHGLDVDGCMDVSGCCFLLVILLGEFFFVPGVVAERGVGDAARIDHYLLRAGFEGGAAEIGGGGLQGVEKK